jgi:hypothetical protein
MNDSLDGHAYAVFADKAALDWMSSADRQAIACGVTGDVRELDGVHIISYDGTVIAWDEVATGDSLGTCAPDGNYHLAITLGAK